MNELKNNLKFLFFFKYILIICFFILFVGTALFFKDVFIFLSNYHCFEILIIGLILFTFWCLYRLLKILEFSKKEIVLGLGIVTAVWLVEWLFF